MTEISSSGERLSGSVLFEQAALSSVRNPNRCIPSSISLIILGTDLRSVCRKIFQMTGGRRSSREAGSTFYVDAKIQRFFHEPVRVGEELHFRLNIKPCEDSSIYLLGGAHGHARPYPPFINDLSGLLLRHPAGANRICDMRLIINPERLILVWRGEQSPLLDTDPLMLLVYNLERYLHTLEVEAERRVKGRTLSPSQNIVKNKIIQEELFNFFVRQYGLMAFVGNYIDGILRRITELQTI